VPLLDDATKDWRWSFICFLMDLPCLAIIMAVSFPRMKVMMDAYSVSWLSSTRMKTRHIKDITQQNPTYTKNATFKVVACMVISSRIVV